MKNIHLTRNENQTAASLFCNTFKLMIAAFLFSNLTILEAKPLPQNFEGKWMSCFNITGDAAINKGQVCTGYTLVQKKHNICGEWSYFATGMYEGLLQAKALKPNQAKLTQICGRSGSETQAECSTDENSSKVVSWEPSQKTLQICHGRLLDGAQSCNVHNAKKYGYKKSFFTQKERRLVKSKAWVKSCLGNP